jgi:dolichol-phosphate mannosyltransferase
MIVSVILPTYNESENVPRIVPAIAAVLSENGIAGEIVVVDDASPDGTAEMAGGLSVPCPIRVIRRTGPKGLSRSILEGFHAARGEICVVLDADMSHPVARIPDMVRPVLEGRCDATVGSRYVPEGGVRNWSGLRRLSSRFAGLLARGVTSLEDPTSGFMAVRKSRLEGVRFDPLGWKTVLEVVVKARLKVLEVPIVFSDRAFGKSKFTFRAQWDYLRHLRRLYAFRYPRLFGRIGAQEPPAKDPTEDDQQGQGRSDGAREDERPSPGQ